MAPYLHYGHISALAVASRVAQHKSSTRTDRDKFIDELTGDTDILILLLLRLLCLLLPLLILPLLR
jgi:hypothetical protein